MLANYAYVPQDMIGAIVEANLPARILLQIRSLRRLVIMIIIVVVTIVRMKKKNELSVFIV